MLAAVRRRWQVFAAVIALTVLLAAQTLSAFPPTFIVEGDYLLIQGEFQSRGIDSATVIATVADSRGFGPDAPSELDSVEYQIGAVDDASVVSVSAVAGSTDLAVQGLERLLTTVQGVVTELTEDGTGGIQVLGRGVRAAGEDVETSETTAFVATAAVLIPARLNATNTFPPNDYTASVLVSAISAPQNIGPYLQRPGMQELSVTTDARGAAPLVTINSSGTELDTVLEVYTDVETEISERLDELQAADVERGARPTAVAPVARPDGPTLVEDNRRRPLAVVVLLGLLVAFGLTLSVDSMLVARAQRREDDEEGDVVVDQDEQAADDHGGDRGSEDEPTVDEPAHAVATPLEEEPVAQTGPTTEAPPDEHASDEPASVGPGRGRPS